MNKNRCLRFDTGFSIALLENILAKHKRRDNIIKEYLEDFNLNEAVKKYLSEEKDKK